MNDTEQQRVHAALHDLADVAAPGDLADRALNQARRTRRLRIGVVAGSAVLAVAVAATALGSLSAGPAKAPLAGGPATGTAAAGPARNAVPMRLKPLAQEVPVGGACVELPKPPITVKEVAQPNWPAFVTTVVGKLPARSDYIMQSGYSWCSWANGLSNSYAVINLGHLREAGELTVNMYISAAGTPTDCAALAAFSTSADPHYQVLFCTPGSGSTPLVYGLQETDGIVMVGAVFADGKAVTMESILAPITAAQLRTVVSDPQVHDLIPNVAAPGPGN